MSPRWLAAAVLAATSVPAIACSSPPAVTAPPDAPTSAAPDPSAPPPAGDPLFACSADADCVIVEMGCCDRCNGGWVLSVAKGREADATAKHHDKGCGGPCTERGCDPPVPVCRAGVCARTEQRFDGPGAPARTVELPNRIR